MSSVCKTGSYCPNCFHASTTHDYDYPLQSIRDTRITDAKVLELIAQGKITDRFKIVDKETILRIQSNQADWKCKHCGFLNPDEGVETENLICAHCSEYQVVLENRNAPERSQSGQEMRYISGESRRW